MAEAHLANRIDRRRGIRNAIPVAVGYIPAAIAYGLLAKNAGMPPAITIGLSLFVYAGASQFAAVTMLASGQSVVSTVLLTLILNFRHFLMSTAIATRLSERRFLQRGLVAFGLTDETFSVASFPERPLTTSYMLALNTTAYVAWVGGSALGYLVGEILPASVQASMGIALYAMFIGLLIPNARGSRAGLTIALLAMALNTVAQRYFPSGLAIVIVALVVATTATFLLPDDRDED